MTTDLPQITAPLLRVTLAEYKAICERGNVSELDKYEKHPITSQFLKSLLQQGKTKIVKKLISIEAASLPNIMSLKIKLLDHVVLLEEHVEILLSLIDTTEGSINKIVSYAFLKHNKQHLSVISDLGPISSERLTILSLILLIVKKINDKDRFQRYCTAISKSLKENDYKYLLKQDFFEKILLDIIPKDLIILQWEYFFIDHALINFDTRISSMDNETKQFIKTRLVDISCLRKSLSELKILEDQYGCVSVSPTTISYLCSVGACDILSFIENNLDFLTDHSRIVLNTMVKDTIMYHDLFSYSIWLIRKGFVSLLDINCLSHLVSLLVKNENHIVLKQILYCLENAPECIFTRIFAESSERFVKKLLDINIINKHTVNKFLRFNYYLYDKLTFLHTVLETSDDHINLMISLLEAYAQHNPMMGVKLIDCNRETILLYNELIFQKIVKYPCSALIINYMLSQRLMDMSPRLLSYLLKSQACPYILDNVLSAFFYTDHLLSASVNYLFKEYLRRECSTEFSMLMTTMYSTIIDINQKDLAVITVDHIFTILESQNFIHTHQHKGDLVNRLITKLIADKPIQYERIFRILQTYFSTLDKSGKELYLSLDCLFVRSLRIELLIAEQMNVDSLSDDTESSSQMRTSFDYNRALLILFAYGCINRIEDILKKFNMNGIVEDNIMMLSNDVYVRNDNLPTSYFDLDKRLFKLNNAAVCCSTCKLITEKPYVSEDGKHDQYFCEECVKKIGTKCVRIVCPICMDEESTLRRIVCGHVYCLSCLHNTIYKTNQTMCSMCKNGPLMKEIRVNPYEIREPL